METISTHHNRGLYFVYKIKPMRKNNNLKCKVFVESKVFAYNEIDSVTVNRLDLFNLHLYLSFYFFYSQIYWLIPVNFIQLCIFLSLFLNGRISASFIL